jgi:hypothetical protein
VAERGRAYTSRGEAPVWSPSVLREKEWAGAARCRWVHAMLWLLVAIGLVGLLLGGAFRAPALVAATGVAIAATIATSAASGISAFQTIGWVLGAIALLNAGFFCAAWARTGRRTPTEQGLRSVFRAGGTARREAPSE